MAGGGGGGAVQGAGVVQRGNHHLPHDHVTYSMMYLMSHPPTVGQTDACENITYPEIGDSSFRCALWTCKQQLTWKAQARCGISIGLV